MVAAAKQIGLRDPPGKNQPLAAVDARAHGKAAGRLLLHRHVHVHLVCRALYLRRFHIDFGKVIQFVGALLGLLDLRHIEPRAFDLTEFAADHFVARLGVAGDVDVPYINTLTGVDHEVERHFMLFLVHLRNRVHVGERITFLAQTFADFFTGLGQRLARESVTGFYLDQLFDLFPGDQGIAGHADFGYGIFRAFGDVDGDVDVLLVRRDGDLRGIDGELQIAGIQIERTHGFHIGRQFLFGILIALAEPAHPVRRAEFHQIQQLGFLVGLIADDVDLLDLGNFAFHHVEHDADAVACHLGDGCRHAHAIFSACHILPFQLLRGFVQRALVEDMSFGQAGIFHVVFELVLGKVLHAVDLDAGYRRTLAHQHDQHALLDFQAHILEKAGSVQGANRRSSLLVVHGIAHFDRQITEHRAGFGTLDTLDANILDGEWLDRPSGGHEKQCKQSRQFFCVHFLT